MKTIKVMITPDNDVIQKYSIRNPAQIEFFIVAYLNDPNGWSKKGYFFMPVFSNADVRIRLSSPETILNKCGLPTGLSCAELGGHNMYLNADRWFHGASKSKLSLDDYRQYMVSHEIGHILGFDHEQCPCKGCPAPIMLQQTLGIGQCKPNTKVR
uniref:DUF3152 domain-containing protein n=1 Tax=viral metagenome TaxID=1070528 RepID=A0A6C0KC68_9ZZZZ